MCQETSTSTGWRRNVDRGTTCSVGICAAASGGKAARAKRCVERLQRARASRRPMLARHPSEREQQNDRRAQPMVGLTPPLSYVSHALFPSRSGGPKHAHGAQHRNMLTNTNRIPPRKSFAMRFECIASAGRAREGLLASKFAPSSLLFLSVTCFDACHAEHC